MDRPEIKRRGDYRAQSPQEEFIVPLLRAAIEAQLTRLLHGSALRVLDVGCGSQPFRALIEGSGASYRSLDVSVQQGIDVDYVANIDAPKLPDAVFEGGPYDVILCSEVLEHVAEWDAAFANFGRLLGSGGHAVLTCPHVFPLHEEPYDFWRPTTHALRFFAVKHRLSVECEERLGSGWDVLGTTLARIDIQAASRAWRHRLLRRACEAARAWTFRLLRARVLQRLVPDAGPFYLSNLVVLRKPPEPAG